MKNEQKVLVAVSSLAILVLLFNIVLIGQVKSAVVNSLGPTGAARAGEAGGTAAAATAVQGSSVTPTGVPEVYGQELAVSYNDVSPSSPQKADSTIRKLGMMDQQLTLSASQQERYINVLYKMNNGISCEYCCGAKAIIFENGQPACGCAHSYAMRGLAKYLIINHGSEYTDEQLVEEISKWKTLFFPTQIQQKAQILKAKGIELTYTNLASNKYRGIEQGASAGGGMVGGC